MFKCHSSQVQLPFLLLLLLRGETPTSEKKHFSVQLLSFFKTKGTLSFIQLHLQILKYQKMTLFLTLALYVNKVNERKISSY